MIYFDRKTKQKKIEKMQKIKIELKSKKKYFGIKYKN